MKPAIVALGRIGAPAPSNPQGQRFHVSLAGITRPPRPGGESGGRVDPRIGIQASK